MSMSAIIRRGEILIKRWESPDYQAKVKQHQTLSDILQLRVELEDTTFGQFFSLIAREADFFEKLFQCAMLGHPIKPYIDECNKPAKVTKDFDFVKVGWSTELFDGDFDHYVCFGGCGTWGGGSGGEPEKGDIAIEFTPLYEYKDLELKLDQKVQIWDVSKPECPVIGTGVQKFTVYDVIGAILDEITWAGDISRGRSGPFKDEPAAPEAAA